jgi:pseudaminic acid synthase
MLNNLSNSLEIAGRTIGTGHPTYIVAEMSANHNQSFDRAKGLVYEAKKAGADAIKLQTYTPDTLTIACDKEYFQIGEGTLWQGQNLYDLYKEAYTPWEWQPRLKEIADEIGLDFFSTPFDETAVDFLESIDVPAHKIASFELVDIPLVHRNGDSGRN